MQLDYLSLAVVQYTFTRKQYIEQHNSLIRKRTDRALSLRVIPWHLPYSWGKSTEKPQSGYMSIRIHNLQNLNKSIQNIQPYTRQLKKPKEHHCTATLRYTSLHLPAPHSLTFTLRYHLIWFNPFTFSTAIVSTFIQREAFSDTERHWV
jgi:hypothetical protein